MRAKKSLFAFLKLALTLVILYFLYRQVAHHWQEIRVYEWEIHWGYLISSVIAGVVVLFVLSSVWLKIIAGFGHKLSMAKAFRIFYLSNLGRYVPGKVWQLLGILYLTKKEGIPPEQAGASFIFSQMIGIPASLLVFVLAAQIEPGLLVDQVAILGDKSAYLMTAAMVAVSLIMVLWPQKVIAIGNAALRKLKRPQAVFALDKKVALTIFLSYSVSWIMYGTAFWLFTRAVTDGAGCSLVAAVGAYIAAYQIGYLAMFAPGGFGPRELLLGVMLAPFLGPIAPAIAIGARLWSIIIESLAALLALAVKNRG
jgi:uncharacterized membrane protein YbhN (UPF0104 family)